jgi:TolB-like protein
MKNFIAECRRRQVFRLAGLYIVGAWVALQVAALAFDNWGIPTEAMRFVWIGAMIGFPIVLVLGWRFDLSGGRLYRTGNTEADADRSLLRNDYLVLGASATAVLTMAAVLIVGILQTRGTLPDRGSKRELDPSAIAVLPFTDMSPRRDQGYLSDGIAEELLNLLARVPELRVISRTSSFAFKGQALEIPEIARRLKVGYVLEGSVRKAGDQIRITAQLIETRSDSHVWSENYDRELENVFAIQDDIAQSVVASLQALLLEAPVTNPAVPLIETNPRAYELVLRGRHVLHEQNVESFRRAREFFEQAVEIAPDYAPAHAGLAKSLKQLVDFRGLDPAATEPAIEAALSRALRLDPQDPDALTTRGKILWNTDVEKAREYWRRAIEINPSDSDAYRWLGYSYRATEPARYLENIRKGYQVNPTNAFMNLHMVLAMIMFGQFDEGLEVTADYHRLDPDAWQPYRWAANILGFQGRRQDALKIYYGAYQNDQDSMRYNELLWHLIDHISAPNELIAAWLDEWKTRAGENYFSSGTDLGPEGAYYLVSGRPDEAVRFITRAWEQGKEDPWFVAYLTLRATADYARVREIYELAFLEFGQDPLQFNPEIFRWDVFTDYALALKHTGEPELAMKLIGEILAYVDQLLAQGVVFGPGNHHLYTHVTMLRAIGDEPRLALEALRRSAATGFFACAVCLRVFPHFNSLRDMPEFEKLVLGLEEKNADAIRRLADEGMLLTPQEVLAIDKIDFDPFAR